MDLTRLGQDPAHQLTITDRSEGSPVRRIWTSPVSVAILALSFLVPDWCLGTRLFFVGRFFWWFSGPIFVRIPDFLVKIKSLVPRGASGTTGRGRAAFLIFIKKKQQNNTIKNKNKKQTHENKTQTQIFTKNGKYKKNKNRHTQRQRLIWHRSKMHLRTRTSAFSYSWWG